MRVQAWALSTVLCLAGHPAAAQIANSYCLQNPAACAPVATAGYGAQAYGGLVARDVNGDGKLDLVALGDSGITTYLGNGDGTFGAAIGTAAARGRLLQLADINGDGRLDAIFRDPFTDATSISVALGRGDGSFTAPEGVDTVSAGFSSAAMLAAISTMTTIGTSTRARPRRATRSAVESAPRSAAWAAWIFAMSTRTNGWCATFPGRAAT